MAWSAVSLKLMLAAKTLIEYLRDDRTELPGLIDERQAAVQIAALHNASGGATFNLHFGNQARQKLFAVFIAETRSAAKAAAARTKGMSYAINH